MAANQDIILGLKENVISVVNFYQNIPSEKLENAYAEGMWTPKDILLHIIDTEHVFVYRVIRIARQDKTEMVGYEQDDYFDAGKANNKTINSFIEEYKAFRNATIVLFDSFSDEELKSIGKANGSPVSIKVMGYIITGNENHHNNVIRERYL